MDALSPVVFEEIVQSLDGLITTKYLSAVAWIFVVWDHAVTFDEEVALVWRDRRLTLAKVIYILNRYGAAICLFYVAFVFSGYAIGLDDAGSANTLFSRCKRFSITLCLFVIIYPCVANSYMSARLYMLWDGRKPTVQILGVAFIVTYIPVVTLTMFTAVIYYKNAIYAPTLNTCVILERSFYARGVWGAMCTFDLFVILFSLLNTLHRPYRHYTEALSRFYFDGAVFFICMFLLRLTNMIIFITVPTLDEFTGIFFAWSMVSITLARLILRVESLKKPGHSINTWVPATNSYEMGRWSTGLIE